MSPIKSVFAIIKFRYRKWQLDSARTCLARKCAVEQWCAKTLCGSLGQQGALTHQRVSSVECPAEAEYECSKR